MSKTLGGFVGDGLRAVPWILVHEDQNPQFPYSPNPPENLVPGTAERHIGRSLRLFLLSLRHRANDPPLQTASSTRRRNGHNRSLHLFFRLPRRKNPTTFPGIMLSEMPIAAEIILPLRHGPCIMIMTDYTVYLDIWR